MISLFCSRSWYEDWERVAVLVVKKEAWFSPALCTGSCSDPSNTAEWGWGLRSDMNFIILQINLNSLSLNHPKRLWLLPVGKGTMVCASIFLSPAWMKLLGCFFFFFIKTLKSTSIERSRIIRISSNKRSGPAKQPIIKYLQGQQYDYT